MTKKAIIVLAEGFEETEAVTCIDILRRANIEVTVAAVKDLKVLGSRKTTVIADKLLVDAKDNFDICVLPGGSLGAANLAASENVSSLIKKMYRDGKIIAAICAAPAIVLAPLGILNNKSATCFPDMESHFDKTTRFKKENVVVDGNIITSRALGTAIPFALTIVEILCGKETLDKVRKGILWD